VLTGRNTVEILQDAAAFYSHLMEDLQAARHSIHLQYFIWGADDFTEQIKAILVAKARAGVNVRLLYDPIGSRAHLNVPIFGTCGRRPMRPEIASTG
jgi:cardiolipin synthase